MISETGFSPRNGEIILKVKSMHYIKNNNKSFSPRNGEIILKWCSCISRQQVQVFQSPQWGDNSKANQFKYDNEKQLCFSPRNGEIILKFE